MKPLPLSPGLLVGLSVRDVGKQVTYQKTELGEERDGETVIAEWKTRKETADEAEFKKADEVRSRARYLVASTCISTRFGGLMICPAEKEAAYEAALAEAEGLIEAFNVTAQHSRLELRALTGQMFESKASVMKAVRSEIQGLLDQLAQAAKLGDVKSLRDAAKNAREMSLALAEGSTERGAIGEAIEAARSLARQVVKRVEKGTSALEEVATEAALAPIMSARFVFGEDFEGEPAEGVPDIEFKTACDGNAASKAAQGVLYEALYPPPIVDRPDTAPDLAGAMAAFQASVDAEHGQTSIYDFDESEPEPPSYDAHGDLPEDERFEDEPAEEYDFAFNRPVISPLDPLAGEEATDLLPLTSRILHALAAALAELGSHAFDDKGPDEVMDLAPLRAEIAKLSPADAGRCRAELLAESQRGQDLVDALFPGDLPAPAAGVTLTLGNAASVLSAFKGAQK